ncbi:MAG: hypothetical protein ACP5EL_06045 [Methanocrinis sp.]
MGLADGMSEEEIADEVATVEFTGVATELFVGEMPGAPTFWAVEVASDEENNFCSEIVNVTVFQATPGPWGTFDENVSVGDSVEVFGTPIMDESGCIAAVTLQGSQEYRLELAEEETEVVEDNAVVEDTEDETEDGEVVEDDTAVEDTEDETENGEVVEGDAVVEDTEDE